MKKTINKSNLIHRQGRSPCLAAARSQNGSGVINTIHYRSAAALPNREGNKRGFTIVEVVVALTVIVIVSAAGMMMVQSQIKAEQKVAQTIEATNIAENAIECFRFAKNNEGSDGFEKTFEDTFKETGYDISAGSGSYVIQDGGLTVYITITDDTIEIYAVNTNGDTILEKVTYTKQ